MTHTVLDPTTNTITTDPEEVARQIVIPAREGSTVHDAPRIIIAGETDDIEAEEHWISLHPAQAYAVGQRLIDLAKAAHDPQQAATTFPVANPRQ